MLQGDQSCPHAVQDRFPMGKEGIEGGIAYIRGRKILGVNLPTERQLAVWQNLANLFYGDSPEFV
jgi:hypothetical protein